MNVLGLIWDWRIPGVCYTKAASHFFIWDLLFTTLYPLCSGFVHIQHSPKGTLRCTAVFA